MTESFRPSPDAPGFPAEEARSFVLAVVRRKLGYGDPDVEDITQDVLLLLIRYARDHTIANWRALAARIAELQVASAIKQRQRRRRYHQPAGPQYEQAAGRDGSALEWVNLLVRDYFAKHMPECLPLFDRHASAGVSFEDLAREMNVTPESLRQRWHRCRKHVQAYYGETVALILDQHWHRRVEEHDG